MDAGVWLVLAMVFMMGTHAAFFSPAKYGAMPEILQPHVLSKGNGVLESSTFLANILGTVSGGLLSFVLHDREYAIGLILLGLSVVGAAAGAERRDPSPRAVAPCIRGAGAERPQALNKRLGLGAAMGLDHAATTSSPSFSRARASCSIS